EEAEVDHVLRAGGLVVDDAVEVDERLVARRVLVARALALPRVLGAQRLVAARGGRAPRRGRHALRVGAPREARGLHLVADGLDARGVDAPLPDGLAVGGARRQGRRDADELAVHGAVALRLGIRRLAAHHGDVVVQARVARAVVLREQPAHAGERV